MILGWAGGGNNNREGGKRDTDRGTEQGFVLPRSSAMGDAEALWSFAVRRFRPPIPNPRAWEERGGKGDSVQVAPVVGEGVEGGPPRAATAAAMGARGELTGGMERERRGLGQVEEDLGVLTSSGIGPRWPRPGDRRGCSAFGEKQRRRN